MVGNFQQLFFQQLIWRQDKAIQSQILENKVKNGPSKKWYFAQQECPYAVMTSHFWCDLWGGFAVSGIGGIPKSFMNGNIVRKDTFPKMNVKNKTPC